jgi:hypothetical protein
MSERARTWTDSLNKPTELWKTGIRFGTWNVRSLYRAGSHDLGVNGVRCLMCKSSFSVGHGSKNCVHKSILANKHKLSMSVKHLVKYLDLFFLCQNYWRLSVWPHCKERTFSIHTLAHNQSLQSIDSTSTIHWKLFEPKFACAESKFWSI